MKQVSSLENQYEHDAVSSSEMKFIGQHDEHIKDRGGKYILIGDEEDSRLGIFSKPLPCFGCGIGWFSFLVGFLCPIMWYYATILYFSKRYRKDPRERGGLAASAIAAFGCTVVAFVVLVIILLSSSKDLASA